MVDDNDICCGLHTAPSWAGMTYAWLTVESFGGKHQITISVMRHSVVILAFYFYLFLV